MADTIKLVQGDSYPTIKLTLYEGDGDTPLNLETVDEVKVHFREAGTTGAAKVITCEAKEINDAKGVHVRTEASFAFDNNELFTAYKVKDKDGIEVTKHRPIDPGQYEGEIVVYETEVDDGKHTEEDKTHTVYDVLRFRVRERFSQ